MKNKNAKSFLIFGLSVAALLAAIILGIELGGSSNDAPPPPIPENAARREFPRELTDAAGEKLLIPVRPQRIASQTLGTDEILLNVCAPEQIVALSSMATDADASNVADLARRISGRVATAAGAEQILQLQPDLIFVASYSRAETVELLRASGAPVFRFANFTSLEDIKANIRTIGYATGCDEKAENLIAEMNADLSRLRARAPAGQKPPRVMSFGGGFTAGKNTTFDDMLRQVGATNVSAENEIEGFAKISAEQIARWQPDFIVAGAAPGELESKKKQMLADPLLAATAAGKSGRVIVIDNRHYLTVSHYITRGIEDLADGLYGNERSE